MSTCLKHLVFVFFVQLLTAIHFTSVLSNGMAASATIIAPFCMEQEYISHDTFYLLFGVKKSSLYGDL